MADLVPLEEAADLTIAEVDNIYEDLRQTYRELPISIKLLQAGRAFKSLLVDAFQVVSELEYQTIDLEDEGYFAYADAHTPRDPATLTIREVKALSSRLTFNLRICVDADGRCGYVLRGPSPKDEDDLLSGNHDLSLEAVLERAEQRIRSALSDLATV